MFNYSSNNIPNMQNKKSYNQISIEKITNLVNQSKQRASSINHLMKAKQKNKISSSKLKAISVNKQIQYKKKNYIHNDNTFFPSYNGLSSIKAQYHTNYNKNINNNCNANYNTNPKKDKSYGKNGVNNYSNNKLRRKMILSVDITNNKKSIKNISQYELNNNIKLITDNEIKNGENINSNTSSNPLSNGAKNNTNTKQKTISINNTNNKNKLNNFLIKSPDKNFNTKNFNKYIEISGDKKNSKHNITNIMSNKKINIQIRQPMKLFEQNSSVNLTTSTSGNYNINFTNSNNDKKYIKPNLKNSNSSTYYKINNNNRNSKNNVNENIGEKIIREVLNIQTDMEKNIKNNITNSKTKKYNAIKHAFEILLKLLSNSVFKNNNIIIKIFLEKILIGYHEVFNAFSMENRKLKQINYNLNEQYEKMSKDLFVANKLNKDKQKLIENLQKRISFLESGIKKKNLNVYDINNINEQNKDMNINKNEQNKKIYEINKKNVEDLDALYFYDKVKIKNDNNNKKDKMPKKAVSIPKIIIKQPEEQYEEEEEEYEIDDNNRTVLFSNICGYFVNSGDVNFKSQLFINIRNAFIL